jgi:hypothetical protein
MFLMSSLLPFSRCWHISKYGKLKLQKPCEEHGYCGCHRHNKNQLQPAIGSEEKIGHSYTPDSEMEHRKYNHQKACYKYYSPFKQAEFSR